MSEARTTRHPKLGEMVHYHESVRQDVWDPHQLVTWPAVVTAILETHPGAAQPRLRLTAFRPYEKPLWDLTADYSELPEPRHWSWPLAD